jgi:hypothetical protein
MLNKGDQMEQNTETEARVGFYPGIMKKEKENTKPTKKLFNTHQRRKRRNAVQRLHEVHRRTSGKR